MTSIFERPEGAVFLHSSLFTLHYSLRVMHCPFCTLYQHAEAFSGRERFFFFRIAQTKCKPPPPSSRSHLSAFHFSPPERVFPEKSSHLSPLTGRNPGKAPHFPPLPLPTQLLLSAPPEPILPRVPPKIPLFPDDSPLFPTRACVSWKKPPLFPIKRRRFRK